MEQVTCTYVNTKLPTTLTVTKVVTNDNGGTAQVSDFTLKVGNTVVTSGVTNSFNAGTYTVSESGGPAGYLGTISGDCDAAGKLTLKLGDVKSCTITNDDQPTKLTVTKVDDAGNALDGVQFTLYTDQPNTNGLLGTFDSGVDTAAGFTCTTGQPTGTLAGTCTMDNLIPGAYWVVETSTPTGYGKAEPQLVTVAPGTAQTVNVMNPRQFTVITLVCQESTGQLYASNATLDGAGKVSVSHADAVKLGLDEAALCGLGGARYAGTTAGSHAANVTIQ
jgi:uncharacterized surface anchored protein